MIGQDRIVASPLAMAGVAATVADGRWHAPRLSPPTSTRPARRSTRASSRPCATLMRSVVTSGTGTALAVGARGGRRQERHRRVRRRQPAAHARVVHRLPRRPRRRRPRRERAARAARSPRRSRRASSRRWAPQTPRRRRRRRPDRGRGALRLAVSRGGARRRSTKSIRRGDRIGRPGVVGSARTTASPAHPRSDPSSSIEPRSSALEHDADAPSRCGARRLVPGAILTGPRRGGGVRTGRLGSGSVAATPRLRAVIQSSWNRRSDVDLGVGCT